MVRVFHVIGLVYHRICFIEQLALSTYKELKNSWEKDYDTFVKPLVEEDQPCYILYRLIAPSA